jgi:hypothetical protein
MVINVLNDGWCPFFVYWLWDNSVVVKVIYPLMAMVEVNMNEDVNELLAKAR